VEVNKVNNKQSLKISVITEKNEQKEPILPKQEKSASSLVTQTNPEQIKKSKAKTNPKPKARTNPKIKRKFRAKTSRNRLQFSVLSMSSPNKSDNDDSYQPTNITKTQQTKKQNAPKLQLTNRKINSLNDFEDDKPTTNVSNNQPKKDESSDDDFDF